MAKLDDTLLLTVREVERELKLGRTLVYALIRRGELPSVNIDGAVRVPRSALSIWVSERTRQWSQGGDRSE